MSLCEIVCFETVLARIWDIVMYIETKRFYIYTLFIQKDLG